MTRDVRRIFVTVGSQMPFDRLACAVDRWLAASSGSAAGAPVDVFGQVGRTQTPPRGFAAVPTLPAEVYERRVREADLVVAHAGTGTIFTALEHGTPLLVLARRAELGETRNDHQDATAARFEARGLLEYARDEAGLARSLDAWRERWSAAPGQRLPGPRYGRGASPELVAHLRDFFDAALAAKERGR